MKKMKIKQFLHKNSFRLFTDESQSSQQGLDSNSPPPSYYDLEGGKIYKAALEDEPPDYEAAIAALEKDVECIARKWLCWPFPFLGGF